MNRSTDSQNLVSIIIPCFNYGHLIAETLNSLIQQSYPDWECIVIDDGSSDQSGKIVADFVAKDSRFQYIHQENQGVSTARNAGIHAARGTFLLFLDADDLIEKRKLEFQVQFLMARPDVDIVYGDAYFFMTGNPDLRLNSMKEDNLSWMPKISGQGLPVVMQLLKANMMPINSPIVRRRVIDTCGFFVDGMQYCEDHEYWLRCALKGMSFLYMHFPESCALIRIHPASASNNQSAMLKAHLLLLDAFDSNKYGEEIAACLSKTSFDLRIELLLEKMRQGDRFRGFAGIAKESVRAKNARTFLLGVLALFLGVPRAEAIRTSVKTPRERKCGAYGQ